MGLWSSLTVIALLLAYVAVIAYSRPHVSGDELRLDTFVTLAEDNRIHDARILDADGIVTGTYESSDGAPRPYHAPYFRSDALRERLAQLLLDERIPTTIDQQFGKSLVPAATILLPALIIVVVFVYLIMSYRRGTGLFGIRSGARRIGSEDAGASFDDVAGQEQAVAELREVSLFLKDPRRFAALGARIPKGILLYGPPGSGKTLLARALAGEAGASFFSISGSDFVELYVGVGASRVRDLFAQARAEAPSIVFIDELDSIGRRRGAGAGAEVGHQPEQEQALNQILAEMDGFSSTEGTILIGATNRPDILDPALLRPGRFDRSVGLERPDEEGRLAILTVHARDKHLSADVDLAEVARRAVGMTGADLASVLNEAALLAARGGSGAVNQQHLDDALERILKEPERQRRLALRDRGVAKRYVGEDRVTFAHVAGVDDAVDELKEVAEYLGHPERFAALGARVPGGVLLSGPPGCGKTLLARAVAGESNAAFLSVAATEFVEVFVGEGAARVRDLFAEARAIAPAIIFIDEIDSIGGRRGGSAVGGAREVESTLNQILVEMDGFEPRSGVIVIGATNRPDILDPALIRPGRFDRQVTIDPPDRAGRKAILELHAVVKPLDDGVDLAAVAGLTQGFSGADLANVLNEASLLAARRDIPRVTMALIDEGIERAMFGVSSRVARMSEEERKVVAYHEAGHALVGQMLPRVDPPHKVTIAGRGLTLGYSWHPSSADRYVSTRSTLVEVMAMALGGRVAEQLVFDDLGDGAANDLARVTQIARRMVCELGMSEAVGPIVYDTNGMDRTFTVSDELAATIEAAIRAVIEEALERAHAVLVQHRSSLDRVAAALLQRETLRAEDVAVLVKDEEPARRPAP